MGHHLVDIYIYYIYIPSETCWPFWSDLHRTPRRATESLWIHVRYHMCISKYTVYYIILLHIILYYIILNYIIYHK